MDSNIDFLRLYEEIFRILPSGDIQKLMNACYDIVGVPILTVDIMYNLLGIAPQQKTGDYYWDYLLENKGYETDIAVKLYEEGIMQSVNEQEAPYIVDWSDFTQNYPKIQGVVKVNDIVEGYVTMQVTQEQITPDRMKAMKIIQESLSFFFNNNDTENSMNNTYQKVFIGELLNNRINTQKQLELWFKNIGYSYVPPYRIMAIGTETAHGKNVLSYIHKTIAQFSLYHLAVIQNSTLYILRYNMNSVNNANNYARQFNQILLRFNAHCGISNYFFDLLETSDYQIQAEDALSLGRRSRKKSHIYYYEDYYLPAILAPRIEQMPKSNYLSPVIKKITEYDKKHSAEFLLTLRTYVKHLGCAAETAEELHIHRNTLLYRINKIEEITNSSIKDYDTFIHLMLSFYMMDYK